MKAVNIIWDTDGISEEERKKLQLPDEIPIPKGVTEEEIGDYLSDCTGFCHEGYTIEP